MVVRRLSHNDPELEEFKVQIAGYTGQFQFQGWDYEVFVEGEQVVGIAFVGQEPLQLLAPVGTPLIRFYVVDYKQSVKVLKAFADQVLQLAKTKEVDYTFSNIPADHVKLTKHLVTIGFQELANRYEMSRPLDKPVPVSDILRFERIKREDVDRFFECMKKFMIGSSDDILTLVLQNFDVVPDSLLDGWYEHVQAFFVYQGDEMIGTLDFRPQTGFISNIGVVPTHRGKGFGSEMLRFCLQLSKETGAKTARLGVHVKNKRAIHVYEKLGFSVDGQLQTFIWRKSQS